MQRTKRTYIFNTNRRKENGGASNTNFIAIPSFSNKPQNISRSEILGCHVVLNSRQVFHNVTPCGLVVTYVSKNRNAFIFTLTFCTLPS
jgi:hypothetical protein